MFSFYILLYIAVFVQSEFHERLDEGDLRHYFGTTDTKEIPHYEFVSMPSFNPPERSASHLYHMRVFGKDYDLVLRPNMYLIAPGCETIYKYSNGTESRHPCTTKEYCYFHGYVRNHNSSSVAVSTCGGTQGVININGYDMMIQPVKDHHTTLVGSSDNQTHLVYKRKTKNQFCSHTGYPASSQEMPVIKRRKRSLRQNLEMRVVVAPDTYKYHGADTERFIKTVMNMVAQIFLDSSLGMRLKISMVELNILENDQNDLQISSDSGILLQNFCQWQKRHENKIADGTLLITKTDLHHNGDKTNVGLGNMDSICNPNTKCSVNEDTGLDTAQTIAHETGHTLGMKHDGDGNSCPGGKFIMSSGGSYGPTASKWSSCSADYLQKFLSSSKASCLENSPTGNAEHLYDNKQYPGMYYSADSQCTLVYGKPTMACTGNGKPCTSFCYEPPKGNAYRMCMNMGTFRADGTECGTGKWCIGGNCVAYGNNGPNPIDGRWGAYDAEWSPCSRTCGGGVKIKTRKCNNPSPRFGGKKCFGEEYLAKLCNVQPCSKSQHAFKEQQCAATNDRNHHYKAFDAVSGTDQCNLKCLQTEDKMIYDRGEKFIDGTDCITDAPFLSKCVQGKCMPFGCDGHLGSQIRFDACGQCGGTGSNCNRHSGSYDRGRAKAYVTFLTVPKGSSSITITNSNVYCHMSVIANGKRLFSPQGASPSGTYSGNGIQVQYRKTGPEKIHIVGPTPTSIEIQVYRSYDDSYIGVKPEIQYTYYVARLSQAPSGYSWQTKASTCSKTCGTGRSIVTAICVLRANNREVADAKCSIFQKPRESIRVCNTQDCPPEWHAYDWGGCSTSCGGGRQSRRVACVTIQRNKYTPVAETRCNAARKLSTSQACEHRACPAVWKTTAWSKCSTTCANGVKTRTVKCYKNQTSNNPVSNNQCNQDQKPPVTEKCMERPCDLSTRGSACKDKESNCNAYGDSACMGEYRQWAQQHCALHCGFCVKDPSGYQTTTNQNCRDTVDCPSYGSNVCTAYASWSSTHCRRHCNLCGTGSQSPNSSTSSNDCQDKVTCSEYGNDICTAYADWSKENCAKTCKLCSGSQSHSTSSSSTSSSSSSNSCKDKVKCSEYGDDICTAYAHWSKTNCAKTCNMCGASSAAVTSTASTSTTQIVSSDPCQDKVNCKEYGDDVCTAYKDWSQKNCPRHCKFCQTCADNIDDCAEYGKEACSGTYLGWAKQNCRHYCNLCGSRRKREADLAFPIAVPRKLSTAVRNTDGLGEGKEGFDMIPVDMSMIKRLEKKMGKTTDKDADPDAHLTDDLLELREMMDTPEELPGHLLDISDEDEVAANAAEKIPKESDTLVPEIESGRIPVPAKTNEVLVNLIESLQNGTPPPPPPKRLEFDSETTKTEKDNDSKDQATSVTSGTLQQDSEVKLTKDLNELESLVGNDEK